MTWGLSSVRRSFLRDLRVTSTMSMSLIGAGDLSQYPALFSDMSMVLVPNEVFIGAGKHIWLPFGWKWGLEAQ